MMINENITIFNQYVDSDDRREKMIPTVIRGVSWYDVRNQQNGLDRAGSSNFMIRIPYTAIIPSGRAYIAESDYRELSNEDKLSYWTIQKNDYIARPMLYTGDWEWDPFCFPYGKIISVSAETIAELREIYPDFVTVVEYADNTVRGTDRTKHWRIGGA